MSDTAIQISDLTVRYGPTVAVDQVALSVARGAVYALVGRNGAGKSSLVRCLLGQQKPQRGLVTLFGEDAWSRRPALMQRVGIVTEPGHGSEADDHGRVTLRSSHATHSSPHGRTGRATPEKLQKTARTAILGDPILIWKGASCLRPKAPTASAETGS